MSGLIVLVVAICLIWLLSILEKSFKPKKTATTAVRASSKSKIQQELYRLVYGDQAMADRLLKQARVRHPGKSEQWIWEKVVEDLERDRGYR